MANKIRLSKRLAELGYCSRREAELLIDRGWVSVNGQIIQTQGEKVAPDDQIEVKSEGLNYLNKKQSIAMYKPIGYVCHASEDKYPHVFDLLKKENSADPEVKNIKVKDFAPVGRLDIDSKGLLILSQDGRLAKAIIDKDTKIEKVYIVKLERDLNQEEIELISKGKAWPEEEKALKPVKIESLGRSLYKIRLVEGKKRQIRRMMDYLGLRVFMLKRIQIGSVRLDGLEEGQWRLLTDKEKSSIIKYLDD